MIRQTTHFAGILETDLGVAPGWRAPTSPRPRSKRAVWAS